jgi:hypothetical protein
MTYYNPYNWIDLSDSLLSDVEIRIQMVKTAKPDEKPVGFMPAIRAEMEILIKDTNEKLHLKEWEDRSGRI